MGVEQPIFSKYFVQIYIISTNYILDKYVAGKTRPKKEHCFIC